MPVTTHKHTHTNTHSHTHTHPQTIWGQWIDRAKSEYCLYFLWCWHVTESMCVCACGGVVIMSRFCFFPHTPNSNTLIVWPCVTTVARKRSQSFCQKCRWQVAAKHTCTLPMWVWMKCHCKLVHGWMVYTELGPRRQHFTWHQPYNNQRALPVHHFRGY